MGSAAVYAHNEPTARLTREIFHPALCVSASISRYVRSFALNMPSIYMCMRAPISRCHTRMTITEPTHRDVEDVPVRARPAQVRQERGAVGDEGAHSSLGLRGARAGHLAVLVHARVWEQVVYNQELRVRARDAAQVGEDAVEWREMSGYYLSRSRGATLTCGRLRRASCGRPRGGGTRWAQ